ncbi:VOC family protein [Lacticaseibacillus paracasei]|nr:VOC family protein [Lacticaseibacillus paracasei]
MRLTEANLAPSAPVTYPWGWRAIGIQDPDGNQLDFVQQVNT